MKRRWRVVANWKMAGRAADLAELVPVAEWLGDQPATMLDIALPATLIAPAVHAHPSLRFGAQDVHDAAAGAFTGGISAAMVADAGARFTLVGHSETRHAGPIDDAQVRSKVGRACDAGLDVILCIGESAVARAQGSAEDHVRNQLQACVPPGMPARALTIAYEPVWAIGSGRLPSLSQIEAMLAAIRDVCRDLFGHAGEQIDMLYGGSITDATATPLIGSQNIDGWLVGKASLKSATLLPILAAR